MSIDFGYCLQKTGCNRDYLLHYSGLMSIHKKRVVALEPKSRVAITGISGYLGTLLSRLLVENKEVESITGIDLKEPSFKHDKIRFVKCDIRDRMLLEAIKGCGTVVHLTFVVQELRDKKLIYDINLNGTKNLLDACMINKPGKLVIASSVAAYGSVKRNSIITEDSELQGNRSSYYSDTKRIVEGMLDEFEKKNPEMIITRIRPSIFCGKNVNNFLRDVVKSPIITYIRGNPYGMPLVYEGDVAEAFYTAVIEDHHGAFNIHAGFLSVHRLSEVLGKRVVGIPYRLAKILADLNFRLGISKFSSHWVELARYPMNISIAKAEKVLHWKPAKTPEQAFVEMMNSVKNKGGNNEG